MGLFNIPGLEDIEPIQFDRIATMNAAPGTLTGYDCPVCRNKGYVFYRTDDGYEMTRRCECMSARQSVHNIKVSGLDKLMQVYTFANWQTSDEWTNGAQRVALDYVRCGDGKWFYICGTPGSGKTHLCTAICAELIRKNTAVKYVLWRDIAQKLKALAVERDYSDTMRELAEVPVLYIDDFMKGTVTDADINRAFELINARYNNIGARTIISSERSIKDIRNMDEATGSRIFQRANGYILRSPTKNWRVDE